MYEMISTDPCVNTQTQFFNKENKEEKSNIIKNIKRKESTKMNNIIQETCSEVPNNTDSKDQKPASK